VGFINQLAGSHLKTRVSGASFSKTRSAKTVKNLSDLKDVWKRRDQRGLFEDSEASPSGEGVPCATESSRRHPERYTARAPIEDPNDPGI